MSILEANSDFSQKDLRLSLINIDGLSQDAFSVTWTVFSSTGSQISGKKLPAVRKSVGRYYAPWDKVGKNGNYHIIWNVETYSGSTIENFKEKFFVIEPFVYKCHPDLVCSNGSPKSGGFVYLVGSSLKRGDLPIFFKNSSGFKVDPFIVYWTIINSSCIPVTVRTIATKADVGEYYVKWVTKILGGDYYVQWDWINNSGEELESKKFSFSIIDPAHLNRLCEC
ncbi:MAG TPA: hypothetical protein ENI76_10430 [Ignavibacteria bacterium]|nr:hypothetical protein [Ignavibacteria bacterium]